MIELILVRKGDDCFFSNPKTNSENALFQTKNEGVAQIVEFIDAELISGINALALFNDLMKHRDLPITNSFPLKQLEKDREALDFLLIAREMFKERANAEINGRELPAFMISEISGECGSIVLKDGVMFNLPSKQSAREALEFLHDEGEIDLGQKITLQNEIEESNLPERCDDELSQLN